MKYDFKRSEWVEFKEDNGIRTSAVVHFVFDDGTRSNVEVDVEQGEYINVMLREEESSNRQYRRLVQTSIDSLEYEGEEFADASLSPSELVEQQEELKTQEERLEEFLSTLTEIQRKRLIYKLENPKITNVEIAKLEGVDEKAIRKTFDAIRKKHEHFFKK